MPNVIQRGDIVEVSLCDDTYRYTGVVISATKRHGVYVSTRCSGMLYHPTRCPAPMKLIERKGRRSFQELMDLAATYP